MHLQKTQITNGNSQFLRFHSESTLADNCLTSKTPKIDGRKVDILQITHIPDARYDLYVEFVYKGSE